MTAEQREQIIAFIQRYARADRPQLFEEGAWLEHHILMNWEQYQRALSARPALSLAQFLEEERQRNPWTRD